MYRIKRHKTDTKEMLINMYIKEKKTIKEISEETGYSIHTIKRYFYEDGVCKREETKSNKTIMTREEILASLKKSQEKLKNTN